MTASRLVSVVASAFALAGCENPAGQTERFLTQGMKGVEEQERGKVPPLPSFRPREVPQLVIERDPFRRR